MKRTEKATAVESTPGLDLVDCGNRHLSMMQWCFGSRTLYPDAGMWLTLPQQQSLQYSGDTLQFMENPAPTYQTILGGLQASTLQHCGTSLMLPAAKSIPNQLNTVHGTKDLMGKSHKVWNWNISRAPWILETRPVSLSWVFLHRNWCQGKHALLSQS